MRKPGKLFFKKSKFVSVVLALFGCGLLLAADAASGATISFNTPATVEGSTIGSQFGPAVIFSLSPLSGDDSAFYGVVGAPLGTWADNTDGTVTGTDLGAEAAADAGIGQLHAYGSTYAGWLSEDGDPNILLTFSSAISAITVTFAGDSTGSSGLAVDTAGVLSNVVHVPVGANTVNETATLTGINSQTILLVPGAYGDWVSVLSISYTPAAVPEPSTWALLLGGAAALGAAALRRVRRQAV